MLGSREPGRLLLPEHPAAELTCPGSFTPLLAWLGDPLVENYSKREGSVLLAPLLIFLPKTCVQTCANCCSLTYPLEDEVTKPVVRLENVLQAAVQEQWME